MDDKPRRQAKEQSTMDSREGTRNIPGPQHPTRSKTCEQQIDGHKMAIHSYQVKQSVNWNAPEYGKRKWHHKDAVYDKCLNANIEPMKRWTETMSAVDKRKETGCVPDLQHPTRSTMCEHYTSGHQTAADSPQQE